MKQSSRSIAAACMALTAVGVAVASTSARADSADVFASAKDAGALAISAKDGGAVQAVGFVANAKDGGGALSESLSGKDAGLSAAASAKDGGFSTLLGAKDSGFSAAMTGKDASTAQ